MTLILPFVAGKDQQAATALDLYQPDLSLGAAHRSLLQQASASSIATAAAEAASGAGL